MDLHIDTDQLTDVPYLAEYFGLWAMAPEQFTALSQVAATLNVQLHMAGGKPGEAKRRAGEGYEVVDGVAIVELSGTLMKHVSSMSRGTSTVMARRHVKAAAEDDQVKSILLHINESPGGTAAGTYELGNVIAEAGMKKPVVAFVEDLGASAAYWAASQASQIFANAPAKIGSIGTYGVVSDMSALAAKEGIKVHVISSGGMKGMAVPGTEIKAEHLQELQRLVNQTNEFFIRAVMSGRDMTRAQVEQLADGRVHHASEAVELGLIDGVMTFEQALSQMTPKPKQETMRMSATMKQLRAAFPKASDSFLCDVAERELTVEQASGEYIAHLELEAEQARKEAAAAKAEAEKAAQQQTSPVGVDEIEETASAKEWSDATAEWNRKIEEQVSRKVPPARAVSIVNRKNPGLREAMLAEANA